MLGACLLGRCASNHLGAIVKSLLGLEGALIPRDTLTNYFGILVHPHFGSRAEHTLDCSRQHFRMF